MQLRVLDVSARLWQVLTQVNIEAAAALIDDQAVFVHMGATLDKRQEMDAIAGHKITLKAVDVQEQSARIHGTAAVALKKIRLTAVVGGNEVENPFVVTETCVDKGNGWRLAALAYTRIVH